MSVGVVCTTPSDLSSRRIVRWSTDLEGKAQTMSLFIELSVIARSSLLFNLS